MTVIAIVLIKRITVSILESVRFLSAFQKRRQLQPAVAQYDAS